MRLVAWLAAAISAVALCFAALVATALGARVGGLLVLSGWCATLALAAWRLPLWWRSGIEYVVTERHVIWRRGRLRRSIERGQVSYALTRWNPRAPGSGDLLLVRAVPTGALRRTLRLSLVDLEAPDRVWAIVRGVEPSAPLGDGDRPVGQRLDEGERVLWTGTPVASRWTPRRGATAALAVALGLAALRLALRSTPPVKRVLAQHTLPPVGSALLVGGVVLAGVVVVAAALGIGWAAWVRPRNLARATRYVVTDRRVLIRRGQDELSLERARIAYVIDAPRRGLHDVFLVLDGPRARGLAASGAFAVAAGVELEPVLESLGEADEVSALLAPPPPAAEELKAA